MTRKRRRFDLAAVDLSIRQDPEGARRLGAVLDALIAGFHARGVEVLVQEPSWEIVDEVTPLDDPAAWNEGLYRRLAKPPLT